MLEVDSTRFRFMDFDELELFVRTWKKLCRGMASNLCNMSITVFADTEMLNRMQLWMAVNRHEGIFLSYPELLAAYKSAYECIYLNYALSSVSVDKADKYQTLLIAIRDEFERIGKEFTWCKVK